MSQTRDELRNAIVLPHDLETERALLGAVMKSNEVLRDLDDLAPHHFHNGVHRKAFAAINSVVDAGGVADAHTIRHIFANEKSVAVYDGMVDRSVVEYITDLENHAGPRERIKSYSKIVRDLSIRRHLIGIGEDVMAKARNAGLDDDPVEVIESAETALYGLKTSGQVVQPTVSIHDAAVEGVSAAAAAYQCGAGLMGLSTGIGRLDSLTGGLAPGDLVVLAGRPGMGKSALGVNVAYNTAVAGHPAGIFALEMSPAQIGQRVISNEANMPAWKVRKGQFSEDQFRSLNEAAKAQINVPLYIDASSGITIAQLVMKARRMVAQYGVELLVVDYLQLLRGSKKASGNRVNEITEITVALKALAKELNIPIIALSQLSRNVEARENKRPVLSDLRESGSIEQDADAVIFIYREEYYLAHQKPDELGPDFPEWQSRMGQLRGVAEVICAKNRHGPTGSAKLTFNADTISFSDDG